MLVIVFLLVAGPVSGADKVTLRFDSGTLRVTVPLGWKVQQNQPMNDGPVATLTFSRAAAGMIEIQVFKASKNGPESDEELRAIGRTGPERVKAGHLVSCERLDAAGREGYLRVEAPRSKSVQLAVWATLFAFHAVSARVACPPANLEKLLPVLKKLLPTLELQAKELETRKEATPDAPRSK